MMSLFLDRFPFTLLFLFRCRFRFRFRFRFLFPFPFLFRNPVSGFSRRPMDRAHYLHTDNYHYFEFQFKYRCSCSYFIQSCSLVQVMLSYKLIQQYSFRFKLIFSFFNNRNQVSHFLQQCQLCRSGSEGYSRAKLFIDLTV